MFFSSHFILKGNTFHPAMIFCPLLHLFFPSLPGNQTQMVPGTDTSSFLFAFCDSDASAKAEEGYHRKSKLGAGGSMNQ